MAETQEYIYIGQYSLEKMFCKIGITNNLDERLASYNAHKTGKSKNNEFVYLFTCEVADMRQVENDIKEEFGRLREVKNKEIYFYNTDLFDDYVNFIKKHNLFIKEIIRKVETKKIITKIVKKATPTLKERGVSRKDVMEKAKKTKNDEFYTRYEDIEKEIAMYAQKIWKDKCVFCNCDDAVDTDERKTSAFALYFMRNFNNLGLKKLICTHYGGGSDIFNQGAKGYVFTYIFTKEGFKELKEYPKGYTGSFDDPLSLKILNEEADIVCTNPPFSIAREYWRVVIESGKKFLIISNFTNVKNQPYISYIMENKVWPGYNEVYWYRNPKWELTRAAGHWYTNLPINDRTKYNNLKIVPLKDIPEKYRKYDDIGTLLVDKNYIPNNYKYPFAVSVFPILSGVLEKGYKYVQDKEYVPYVNGERKFGRVLVQKIEA